MWEHTEWMDWIRYHPETADLSFQKNLNGEIPLSCGKCKKKVQDIEPFKKGPENLRRIYCSLCGWESYRTVGNLNRKRRE